ncbi:MAG TPA: hypothetical protein V6C78_03310 [Crinalium sp.]|jgi:hypothetical protein
MSFLTNRRAVLMLMLLSFTGCGMQQRVIMTTPNLARLEIPDNTLLLYEHMAVNDSDRTGNWRFRFDNSGCFFHTRNTQLWVTDSTLPSDAPELHWNTSFPDTPNRCLNDSQYSELIDAIHNANFASLNSYYSTSEQWSHSSVERWTVVDNGMTHTVSVENRSAPRQLVQLRQTIDQLIAGTPAK